MLLERWLRDSPGLAKEALEAQAVEALRTGLVLEADGAYVPLTLEGTRWDYGQSVVIALSLSGSLPAGVHTVRVSNGNEPDASSVYRSQVWLDPSWAGTASLPLDVWRQDERYRELTLQLAPTSAWQALWAPERRGLEEALPGVPTWLYGVLAVVLLFGLSALVRLRRER